MKKGYQPILDYVEGRISAEEFQNFFMTKSEVKNVLKQPMSAEYAYLKDYGWSMYKYLQCKFGGYNKNWNTIRNRRRIQIVLSQFLNNFNIQHTQYPKYRQESDFILDIQPSWLDINNDDVFQKVIEEIPNNLSTTQQIKLGKEKVKALFKYDKTYPRWVQSPEWPIVNGKPLVFSHQKKVKGDDCHTYYYFYDEQTKEQTIVEQFG